MSHKTLSQSNNERLYRTATDENGHLFPMNDEHVPGVKLSTRIEKLDAIPEYAHLKQVRNSDNDGDRTEAIYETFCKMGIKGSDFFSGTGKDAKFDPNKKLNNVKLGGSNIKFARTGDDLLTTTSVITGVFEAVTPFVQNAIFDYFPEMSYAAWKLLVDKIQPIAGMLGDNPISTPTKFKQKRGFSTLEMEVPQIGNAVVFDEQDILSLRSPGSPDLALRGISQLIAYNSRMLEHQGLVRRQNDIYSALFNNEVKWYGKTYALGIPSANYIDISNIGGQNWGSISSTGVVCNATANPISDFANVVNFSLTKVRGLPISMFMNHKTNQLIIQNPNVISRVATMYANASVQGIGQGTGGINADMLFKYYMGGDLNIKMIIDNSQYIADAEDPNGYTAGTVNTIIPDGRIYIFIDTKKFGSSIGEYAYALSTKNGGAMAPKPGKYFQMIDTTVSSTVQGVQQPNLFLLHGWNGGIRLFQNTEVYCLDVLA